MRQQIEALRCEMKAEGIDAYIIPTTDFHGSEYVNEYFKCREFVSGFTGSAGTLLVTDNWAGLWTDGRYFLQAEEQLWGSGIGLMREREPNVPTIEEYLREHLPEGSCLGFDGRVVSFREAQEYEGRFRIRWDADLAGRIWDGWSQDENGDLGEKGGQGENRPELIPSPIYDIPLSVTGESSASKLNRLRQAIKEKGADMHLMTSLEEIAWLYNLRGNDVRHTPVFFAFAIIGSQGEKLYVLDESFISDAERKTKADLPETTEILPYFRVFDDLKNLPAGKLLLSEERVSYAMAKFLPETVEIIDDANPAELMKAIKNEIEIRCTQKAHIRDGAAVVQFIYWIKKAMVQGAKPASAGESKLASAGESKLTAADCDGLTEADAADYLLECRLRQKGFNDLSFDTIAAYGPNGAIVHYDPSPETCMTLKPEGFILVDSGGQYENGTTDITRTIALGPLTEDIKRNYTLVLKSHIALAASHFPEGTTGAELDIIARAPLAAAGLDYNHGTGHGVGHLLSVHEGPNKISPLGGGSVIKEGMITSDEPGLYLTGQYGIRLENEILCVKRDDGELEFEPITWCPWEPEAILPELLTEQERKWLNDYHKAVYEKLSPLLDADTGAWLRIQTAEI